MNILLPDSWLREYLETNASPEQIKDCLSLCGPSVERINKVDNDYIYEIEIPSNRVDAASVYGIAREAIAILPRFSFKAKLRNLKINDLSQEVNHLPMEVSDPQKICNRIMGIVLEVDLMKPSPDYIKERIEKSGVRALNNLVDVTNYVMLELGHPCHVFDYDRIKTHQFLIRFAKKNEPIVTLDEKKYLLCSEDVIIDDGTGRVIDLPGIMGTENSVVNQYTRRIFFFIEANNPILIRKTSMRYGIRTMAATINKKHPDPELTKIAMLRGIELYQKIASAKIVSKLIDIYPYKPKPNKITVSPAFINERLGIELKDEEMADILKSLSFQISKKGNDFVIMPPSFRQFDVTIAEDIVEEVARIYGYHNLPSRLMEGEIPITNKPKILDLEEKIKLILKYWGYSEVYNYSFISRDLIEKTQLKTVDHLKVANPLTSEIEYMRITLIPSILETVYKNQFYSDNLQLFELANVYQMRSKSLPFEYPMLAITNQNDLYKLKGLVETLLKELGITDYVTNPDVDPTSTWAHFWHPKQTLSLEKNHKVFAVIGKIHPSLSSNFQIKNDLYLSVLNLEMITHLASAVKSYTPISLYPAVIEDITIQYPSKTYIGPVMAEINQTDRRIKKVEITTRYHNSTTLKITYHDDKKNLTSQEVKTTRCKILQLLKTKYKATLKE